MYQTSQSGYSGLESLTSSYQNSVCYSKSGPISNSYDNGMFVPSSSISEIADTGISSRYSNEKALYQIFTTKPEYNFIPENFLLPGRDSTFVGKAEPIREHVEDAFRRIFDQEFPNDVKISVLEEKKFRKLSDSPGTVGLSINRSEFGLLSEIFVLNGDLANVMLTIGHELGHVLSPRLGSSHDEEAKAYAFSLIWMKTLKDNDIAGLGDAIIFDNPALNGLHDVAFNFVTRLVKGGKDEWSVYKELMRREISVAS